MIKTFKGHALTGVAFEYRKGVTIMAYQRQEFKELSCRDFRSDCDFTIRAQTEKELLDKCKEHACSAHNKCNDSPKVAEKIKSRIRNVQM